MKNCKSCKVAGAPPQELTAYHDQFHLIAFPNPPPVSRPAYGPGIQARSQVRKRGGSGKKNVDPKWAWVTKRGRVREGEVPPPAPRAEAFENIDLATKKN